MTQEKPAPAGATLLTRLDAYNRIAFDILALQESGESVTQEKIDEFEKILNSLCEKADSYGHVLSQLELFQENCKKRKAEWDAGRRAAESSIESLKFRMRKTLTELPDSALQGDEFRFFLTKPTQDIEIDSAVLPKEYMKATISYAPDVDRIKKDLADGKTIVGVKSVEKRQLRTGRPK